MKVIGIFILTLLLTLSTFSIAETMAGEPGKTSEVFTVDCEETYSSADIEDDKHYLTFFHTSDDTLTGQVDNEEQTCFQSSSFSLLKPPKTLFA
ncbi:MAG: hypothetical protein ABXS91_07190 [Sulfurimonas sp.]